MGFWESTRTVIFGLFYGLGGRCFFECCLSPYLFTLLEEEILFSHILYASIGITLTHCFTLRRVEDFRDQLNDIVVDPRRMSHATRTHELFVHSIYESADTSNRRKRKRVTVAEPTKDHPDVATLRAQLEGVKLKSWR